ncbi:MAG TPA: UDP-N-acetylmuramoyl-tripeptide--D-alanyl-D-alanine ligase [Thermoclostridium sp.]|nr:UDP-N-acetylmuramoyl-tripeptide--D-alanyl-D-alanine ligase [Thermoclostridium sp.]
MQRLQSNKICQWINGRLIGDELVSVDKVSTDTRALVEGSLFVAIRGKSYDGHEFIDQAFEKGAMIVISEEEHVVSEGTALIIVEDTIKALGELARNYIKCFDIPIIAITGSVGKTTSKEMIAQVLSTQYNVHKTKGNFNNHIGLPLSVLELNKDHDVAVFEMGMNAIGEIDYLSKIIRPDIGVVTNIGISHIEKLGSRQNIFSAKLEIIHGMKDNSKLILNGDDELLSGLEGLLPMPVSFYGINENSDVYAYGIESMGESGVRFNIEIGNQEVKIILPVPGIHNVSGALTAVACGLELGISNENIKKGLAQYSNEKMRLNIFQYDGVKIINDSYNAAPDSTMAAITVLREVAGARRSIAVLGDMFELGEYAAQAHEDVGAFAVRENIDYLIAIGDLAKDYVIGAVKAGMSDNNIKHFSNSESAVGFLKGFIKLYDVVLFKGSRGMNLDKVIENIFGISDSVAK